MFRQYPSEPRRSANSTPSSDSPTYLIVVTQPFSKRSTLLLLREASATCAQTGGTLRSVKACGFNRSMQHTRRCMSSGGVANEAEALIYYTEIQKALMWERWRKGDTLHQIARLFDRYHSPVQRILAESGGIQPAPRHRSRLALTLAEREEISRSVVAGLSIRSIAFRLGRAPSTISRELRRNGGIQGYRANQADELASVRAHRPKTCKLIRNRTLAQVVAVKLTKQWSPEQLAGWLKHAYAVNKDYQVSHETIYRSLYVQARGALKKELLQHLRRCRIMRHSRILFGEDRRARKNP